MTPDEELLPEVTSDERDIGWGEAPADEGSADDRLRADRPPHWDDRE